MSSQLTRETKPPARRLARRNSMTFPRDLRRAIPDLHGGRMLELDTISGRATNTPFFGPVVHLKLVVKETGKLKGEFTVGMDLQPDAARQMAATLTELANQLS